MKILHCCLAAFYIDNYGYQENILPKMHKLQGHEVMILASTETYIDNHKLGYCKPRSYFTKESIPIIRVPYKRFAPHFIMKKLRIYSGLSKFIKSFSPDIIFLHDCQFLSIREIIFYAKKNPNVKIFVDSHTDFINSARGWISKNILHRIIYRNCAKRIEKYAIKFYGTLPARNDFLENVYGISKEKIELLPFGVDDSLFNWKDKLLFRSQIRKNLKISEDDFVIISGGKIDQRKNIHFLLKAFIEIDKNQLAKPVKIIIFGTPVPELKELIDQFSLNPSIYYLQWIPSDELFKYFFASDLAFFPGTHSVLWEEAVGLGLPCVFLRWEGIQHVNLEGNCLFIEKGDDVEEIKSIITKIVNDDVMFKKMSNYTQIEGPKRFSYSQIAKQILPN